MTRREFLARKVRCAGMLALGGGVGALVPKAAKGGTLWQIDPEKCIACEKCATSCVLAPSAVKCIHAYGMCGYCELCFGFFEAQPSSLDEGAENQRCPTGAIKRTFIEDPYYEYIIDEKLCIGCGRCVKGCITFGNGSMHMQISHDVCVHCNQCAIALVCPAQAFVRVSADQSYILKNQPSEQGGR
ncbi:MAG: ferredoxin [Armatimonadetes bacterium]|nr:ferredoxin [Armatimonadota bacterium]